MNAIYLVLLLISAATLAYQVALTRFFSLAQGSHLAFMAVSLALLGIGASGTYLSLRQQAADRLSRILTGGAILFALSVPASYLAINYSPFDAYRLAWERSQLVWLLFYYLALAVPFFFSGLVIGAALAGQPEQAGPLYGANMLGSGLGTPLALLALATVGGPGAVFLCAWLGWLAAVSSQVSGVTPHGSRIMRYAAKGAQASRFTPRAPRPLHCAVQLVLYPAITIAFLYLTFRPPPFFDVRLTPYKALSQTMLYPDSELIFSRWNAFSRVDVLRSSSIRSAPGLSFTYPGGIPPQLGLTVDGDNLSPITRPTGSSFTRYLPLALAFELRAEASTLILEPGGGLAVLTALQNGAQSVTVVQSNHTVVEAVGHRFADFNDNLYDDPRVTVVIDEPRSFLRRTGQQFDLIILPLTDSFRPVTAGAYTLNEDYRYTVEAFVDALAHLSPDGLLVVERWLQLPPSESLRLWGTAIEALAQLKDEGGRPVLSVACPATVGSVEGVEGMKDEVQAASSFTGQTLLPVPAPFSTPLMVTGPAAHLLAIRSLQTSLIVAARAPLSKEDLARTRHFAAEQQFDPIWLPDIRPDETNRYSVVPESIYYQTFAGLLASPRRATFYADYPYAVAPPTDDHPFFFHFFKWQQTPEILQTLGKTWQPFGGSGYLVLVVLLALVLVLSVVLILLPLLWQQNKSQKVALRETERPGKALNDDTGENSSFLIPHASRSFRVRYLLYFTLLGLGFLFVEIPLLQRFILFLGQPAYAFAIVVSAVLVASGLGSRYLSGRLPLRVALPLITVLAIVYPLLLPHLFDATLKISFAGRIAVTIVALFPLGVLLGVPFPRGMVLVGQKSPELVPWVWAVNGCASVISAVLAAMIALTWGFSAVIWSAALAYGLAGLVIVEQKQR